MFELRVGHQHVYRNNLILKTENSYIEKNKHKRESEIETRGCD